MKKASCLHTTFFVIIGSVIMALLLCCAIFNSSETPCYASGTVNVTLYNDNGDLIKSDVITSGQSYSPEEIPEQNGLRVLGWYDAQSGGEEVNFLSVTEDVSAYARYEALDFSEKSVDFQSGVEYDGINGASAEITVLHPTVLTENVRYYWYKFVDGEEELLPETGSVLTVYNCRDSGTYKGKAEVFVTSQSGKVYTVDYYDTGYLGISKKLFDMSGIHFEDKEVAYTGEFFGIELTYDEGVTAPFGVEIRYSAMKKEIGSYTMTVSFTVPDEENYEGISSMTATLTISQGSLNGTVLFESAAVNYNGEEKFIFVKNLPSGCSVEYFYQNEPFMGKTDAGNYQISARIEGGENYRDTELTAVLTINKVQPILNLKKSVFEYDGSQKLLEIQTNSDGVVSSEEILLISAGEYRVTISVAEGKNHLAYEKSLAVTIKKANYSSLNVVFGDSKYTYDGNVHRGTLTGAPEGTTVSYLGGGTDVGVYVVKACLIGNRNYVDAEYTSKTTIIPREVPVSFDLTTKYVADGSVKVIAASAQALPGDRLSISVVSVDGREIKDAGRYVVKAVTPNPNYSLSENQAELEIYAPSLTDTAGSTIAFSEGVEADGKFVAEFKSLPDSYLGVVNDCFGEGSTASLLVCYVSGVQIDSGKYYVCLRLSDAFKENLKSFKLENVAVLEDGKPIYVKNIQLTEDTLSFESGALGDFLIIYREKTFFERLPLWSYFAVAGGILLIAAILALILSSVEKKDKKRPTKPQKPIVERVITDKNGKPVLMPEKAAERGWTVPREPF